MLGGSIRKCCANSRFCFILEQSKMVTQWPIPTFICSSSFYGDDNRTSAAWCGFFLAATGAPSIPIYLMADDWCN